MIQNQTYVFLWSVVIGAFLALIFDFFRILRRKGKTKNFIVYIQDIIYWILVTIIIIMSAFITNDGELRGYMFIGYILGSIIYLASISKIILKISNFVLDFIEAKFKSAWNFFVKITKKLRIKKKNVNF
ncbi:MAG: spore cortex biosynthesis protein YabQ [Clostridia bacterium]|nr:spore cortex biosynthesis protein YabQ [Clostridia bacterium]